MAAFKRFLFKATLLLMVVLLLGLTGWYLVATKYVYSTGERAGYVQKFSRKGWIIKTWEGEIAMVNLPGTVADRFAFTVRDPKIAEEISSTLGKRVVLNYAEHRFLPGTLFGDTNYWVSQVRLSDAPDNDTLDGGLRGTDSSAPSNVPAGGRTL